MADSIQSLMNDSLPLPRIAGADSENIEIKTEIEESSWQQSLSPFQHIGFSGAGSSTNNSSNMCSNPFFYPNIHNTNGYPQNLSMDLYNFYHQPFLPNFNVPTSSSTTDNSVNSEKNFRKPSHEDSVEKPPPLKVPQYNYQENGVPYQNNVNSHNYPQEKSESRYLPGINQETNQILNVNNVNSGTNVNNESNLKCWKCEMPFYCEKDMNTHIALCFASVNNSPLSKTSNNRQNDNENKLKYTCEECSYSCQSPAILKIHSRTHSGEKPFSCDFCDYKSGQKNNVTKHVLVHMKEKPFRCQYCDYRCAQKNNLVIHERTHTGEKPFACTFCEYKTVQKPNLVKHMYLHTNQKPFICEICNYRCVQKTNLIKHKQKHTMEKPFECNECDYKSSQKANLMKHQFSHGKEKPLQCDLCPYKCVQKCNLEKHKQSKHSKPSEAADNLGNLLLDKNYSVKSELSNLTNGFLPPNQNNVHLS